MTAMPILESERLLIRPLVMDDLETIHAIMNAGFGESPLEERREWLEWSVRNYVALGRLFQPPYGERGAVLKETGELVGAVGLVPSIGPYARLASYRGGEDAAEHFQPEFGLFWAIAPAHQRRGYAAEAAQRLIDYVFAEWHVRRIVATTEFENVASIAVMRRLGMVIGENRTPGDPPWFQVVGTLHRSAR